MSKITFNDIYEQAVRNFKPSPLTNQVRHINHTQEQLNMLFNGYLPYYNALGHSFQDQVEALRAEVGASFQLVEIKYLKWAQGSDASPAGIHRRLYGNMLCAAINVAQYKFVLRQLMRRTFGVHQDSIVIRCLAHRELNKTLKTKLVDAASHRLTKALVLAFYSQSQRSISYNAYFNECINLVSSPEDKDALIKYLSRMIYDAVMFRKIGQKHRSDTVVGLVRAMRASEDFGTMPILADALQDADYMDTDLLNHLRNPEAVYSLGSGIFRAFGVM